MDTYAQHSLPRLHLESFSTPVKFWAGLKFIPKALREIATGRIGLPLSFHIHNARGILIGVSGQCVCYPTIQSGSYELLKQQLVSVEDRRFFEHKGVDVNGVLRAIVKNIHSLEIKQGGSTITQQLARSVFLSNDKSFARKLVEILLAREIERHYSKEEILEAYCTSVYLGQGIRGFEAAAKFIYRRPLHSLYPAQIAGLIGLLTAPNKYSPLVNKSAFLTRAKKLANRFEIVEEIPEPNPINPSIFKSRRLERIISTELAKLGLQSNKIQNVETTICTPLQSGVDDILRVESEHPDVNGIAAVVICNRTGDVLAESSWCDGINWDFSPSYFGQLQPGSTFKTFAFISALEQGYSPDFSLESSLFTSSIYKVSESKFWDVRNYAGSYQGTLGLSEALQQSDNTVFARLSELLDLNGLADTLERFSLTDAKYVPPSTVLGAVPSGINLIKLAAAYAAIARNGVIVKPRLIRSVIYRDASISAIPRASGRTILSSQVTAQIQAALQKSGLVILGKPFSGKSGTTKKGSLFAGYNEDISVALWVGFRKPQSENDHKGLTAKKVMNKMAEHLLGYQRGRLMDIT